MPILDISIIPVGTPGPSISSYIQEACDLVDGQGLHYKVTPTSTVIEGELDTLLQVARNMHLRPFQDGAERVVTTIMIDERHDKREDMERMERAVLHPEAGAEMEHHQAAQTESTSGRIIDL